MNPLADYKITPIYMTAEQIEKRLKEAQEFLKKYPMPPRKDPKDVVQAASTQRLMSMTDEELEVYRNRELKPDEFNTYKDFVLSNGELNPKYARNIKPEEFTLIDGMRKVGHHNTKDQSTLSSASDERKELARQAFSCTPPAELTDEQKERLTNLSKITEYKGSVPEEEKSGLFDSLKKWFKRYAPSQGRHSYAELQEILRKEKE